MEITIDAERRILAMKKEIRGVIFDWGGTTVNYGASSAFIAFIEVFQNNGIDITWEEVRQHMGIAKIDHIRALLQKKRIANLWKDKYGKIPGEKEVQKLFEEYEPALLKIIPAHSELLKGVLEVTAKLRKKGIRIGTTTSFTPALMKAVQKETKKQGYEPDLIVTPEMVGKGRPYPNMIFRNMEESEIFPPSAWVKVGDTISDMEEGYNAGVWTVGVIEGSSFLGLLQEEYEALSKEEKKGLHKKAKEAFRKAGAHYVIRDLTELPKVLEKINHKMNR